MGISLKGMAQGLDTGYKAGEKGRKRRQEAEKAKTASTTPKTKKTAGAGAQAARAGNLARTVGKKVGMSKGGTVKKRKKVNARKRY